MRRCTHHQSGGYPMSTYLHQTCFNSSNIFIPYRQSLTQFQSDARMLLTSNPRHAYHPSPTQRLLFCCTAPVSCSHSLIAALHSAGFSHNTQCDPSSSLRVSWGMNFSIPTDIFGGRAPSRDAAMKSVGIVMSDLWRVSSSLWLISKHLYQFTMEVAGVSGKRKWWVEVVILRGAPNPLREYSST